MFQKSKPLLMDAIEKLAEFFSGSAVATNSMALSMGGVEAWHAQQYFNTRSAFGVQGYASAEEAKAAIIATFRKELADV